MLKPSFQPIHDGSRVGPAGQSDVVAFEGFNKALGHPIALGALYRSRDWFKYQGPSKGNEYCSRCNKTRYQKATPRKPLHFVGSSPTSAKPIFNSLHHQISNKIRRLPFLSNKAKIETSVPIGVRDEEVKVHRKSDCGYFGRR